MKVRNGYVSNSSSSSFIIKSKMSKEEVESVMKTIVEFWNDEKFTENDYTIKPITQAFVDGLKETDLCSEVIETARANIGNYRVTARSDNTIPFDLFPIIERKLGAYYFHLGYDFEHEPYW